MKTENANIYLDIETSGLFVGEYGKTQREIIKISAIKVGGGQESSFDTFIRPENELTEEIQNLTGITNDLLLNAPPINDVLKKFNEFVGNATIVSYNAQFVMRFLRYYGNKNGLQFDNDTIDLLPIVKNAFPNFKPYSLCAVCGKLKGNSSLRDVEKIKYIAEKLL